MATKHCSENRHILRYCPDEGTPPCGELLYMHTGVSHRQEWSCARPKNHEGDCRPWATHKEFLESGWNR